jgi:hypothetical protein
MGLLKGIVGKIAAGLVALAVVAAGISWWQMDLATRHAIAVDTGRLIGWTLVVLLAPWASFWLIGWVAKMDSNRAGAAMVMAVTAVEAVVLAWLFGFAVHGPTAWTLLVAGVLVAGVYNLFACDWIAEKVG